MQDSNKYEKARPLFCLIICCIISLYFAFVSPVTPIEPVGFVITAVFVCAYSALFFAERAVLPVVAAVFGFAAILLSDLILKGLTSLTAVSLLSYAFAVFLGAALYNCMRKAASKSYCFAVVSSVYVVYFVSLAVLIIFIVYEKISFKVVGQALDDLFGIVSKTFREALNSVPFSENNLSQSDVKKLVDTYIYSMIASIPSAVAFLGMAFAAVTNILYRLVLKLTGFEKTVLGEREWKFEMSSFSACVFYISYVVYFFAGFFADNTAISVAFMNVSAILSVPFAYIGFRTVFGFVRRKAAGAVSGVVAAVLCAFVLLIATSVAFTILSFVGAASVINKKFVPKG